MIDEVPRAVGPYIRDSLHTDGNLNHDLGKVGKDGGLMGVQLLHSGHTMTLWSKE
jgi:hypothetical protein